MSHNPINQPTLHDSHNPMYNKNIFLYVILTGIMEMLQSYYSKPNKLVAIQYVAAATDHYSGSQADRGWGCGYRNFQMLLSCLLRRDEYKQVVFNGKNSL